MLDLVVLGSFLTMTGVAKVDITVSISVFEHTQQFCCKKLSLV